MSITVQHLFSHLDRFPENFGNLNEEQDKRLYQGINTLEKVCRVDGTAT